MKFLKLVEGGMGEKNLELGIEKLFTTTKQTTIRVKALEGMNSRPKNTQ